MNVTTSCSVSFTGVSGESYVSFINTLMAAQCALHTPDIYPSNYGPDLKDGDEFDFIVVGAGSAGSILASRLSENPKWKVLLLEAGDYPSTTTEVPKLVFTMIQNTEDWSYNTESMKTACLGLNNKKCNYPRGKVLGGSGSINAMFYIRGNKNDYNNWAEKGNDGWDYDSVLKHFEKFEDTQGHSDGKLKIMKYVNDHLLRKTLMEAYKELGYGPYGEENPQGYLDADTTINNGTRSSTAKTFLIKMKERNNAYLAVNAQVAKILLDSDLRTKGVQVRINGKLIQLKTSKEVILSAGAINSPQILMNSGVGPRKHLEELDIPVLKDLKVGENLQDHVLFPGLLLNMGPNILVQRTSTSPTDDWYEYLMYRKGPLSTSGSDNFLFFFNSKNISIYPNLQMYIMPVHQHDVDGSLKTIQKMYNLPPEVVKIQNENNKKSHNVIMVPALSYPASVGKVLLKSSDPFDKPKIFTNYFSDDSDNDVITMLQGVRFYQNLVRTKAFMPHKPKMVHIDLLNCGSFAPDSDDYWKCAIRNIGNSVYHPVGSCKMGPKDDSAAVVDSRLRVYGIKGLRVVDASIMPRIVSCNPNAAVIMIGQKASEMIKEDWSYND
ncbi:hypothetical protein FQA39_LY16377 [Lamprigera yunnana]|nr:hypothetical protein FQA39_LY16377 [Lamprigera yunnana]